VSAQARDAAVAEDVLEVLSSHRTLAGRPLTIEIKGGIAHVRGRLQTADQRQLLRSVLARVRGVQAVWDDVATGDRPADRILDLGCGPTKQWPGNLGVDRHPYSGVDVLADLEQGLPFRDESFDQIFAVHVLEHIQRLVPLMNDLHRLLRRLGILHVMVPRWGARTAVGDPTHVRLFDRLTLEYFCTPRPGLCTFRPRSVAETEDTVVADLEPVKAGQAPPSDLELARHFH
jgi:SAM-dependent methyltransferase